MSKGNIFYFCVGIFPIDFGVIFLFDLRHSKEFHATPFSQTHRHVDGGSASDAHFHIAGHGKHERTKMGGRNHLPDGEIRDGVHEERGLEPDDGARSLACDTRWGSAVLPAAVEGEQGGKFLELARLPGKPRDSERHTISAGAV